MDKCVKKYDRNERIRLKMLPHSGFTRPELANISLKAIVQ